MPDPTPEDIFAQFGDLFGDLFGTVGAGAKRGPDLRVEITLDLAEIDAGTERTIEATRFMVCEACAGRGAPPEVDPDECESCGGSGALRKHTGAFAIQTSCEACRGRGETFQESCRECEGEGGASRLESLTIKVPPGVAEGQTLRLKGKGNDLGQGAGDLYCAIHMTPDPRFSREGDDLHACLVLGNTRVELPFGSVEVRVPEGAKAGDRIELRGQGITKLGSPAMPRPSGDRDPYRSIEPSEHRGNLIVHLIAEDEAPPYSDYAVLGVSPGASPEAIQAAFRRLAIELHPDRSPDDAETAERFTRVSEAYARLSRGASIEPIAPDASAPAWWMWMGLALVAAALIYFMTK